MEWFCMDRVNDEVTMVVDNGVYFIASFNDRAKE